MYLREACDVTNVSAVCIDHPLTVAAAVRATLLSVTLLLSVSYARSLSLSLTLSLLLSLTDAPSSSTKEPAAKKAKGGGGGGGGDPKDIVASYLRQQNRPYSLLVIFENLHQTIKKAQLQKILDELVTEGVLQCKLFKKMMLYMAKQGDEKIDPAEVEQLNVRERELREQINAQKSETNKITSMISALQQEPSDEEIKKQTSELQKKIEELQKKIAAMKSGNTKPITKVSMPQCDIGAYPIRSSCTVYSVC